MKLDIKEDISVDFETFSRADLKKVGAHCYAEHESTEALCMAWAPYGKEPQLWTPGQPCPPELEDHILMGGRVRAWNAVFERLIFTHVMSRLGWPIPSIRQYVCTMTEAYAMALPGQLASAAPAVGLDIAKDDKGHRVMLQLSKPRKPTKKLPLDRFTPETHPDKFSDLYDYCLQDVRVEQAIAERLVRLKPSEQELYWRDQDVQDRGINVDLDLVKRASEVIDDASIIYDARIKEITGGKVKNCKAVAQIITWLKEQGVEWPNKPSIDKDNVARLLARDDLTPDVREVITLRQEAGKASTAKLERFQSMRCADGTIKGSLQLLGAGATGRDAARGVQLQNLPRPNPSTNVKEALDHIREFDADLISVLHGPPMGIVSDCLRSMVIAKEGKRLFTRDLSQIEARMTAWIGEEEKALDAFRAFDAKTGPDIYTIAAADIYNVPASEIGKGEKRQVGKVACIAEGELVLTDQGLVPIERVTTQMQVWDGEEWVAHAGVICNGIREVIAYDGLTATPDHNVFTRDGRKVPFGDCAREQIAIAQTGSGRTAIRVGDDFVTGGSSLGGIPRSSLPLHGMRSREMDQHGQPSERRNERLSVMLETPQVRTRTADRLSEMDREAGPRATRAVLEPEEPAVSRIWGARDSVSLYDSERCRDLDSSKPLTTADGGPGELGDRPHRHEWALRSGQPTFPDTTRQREQSPHHAQDNHMGRDDAGDGRGACGENTMAPCALRRHDPAQQIASDVGRRSRDGFRGSEVVQTRRVWDIINAGPRNRFTVSGRLVCNCLALGFGGGAGAFGSMAKIYQVDLVPLLPTVWEISTPENREKAATAWNERGKRSGMKKEAWLASELVKLAWREANPNIVRMWRDLEQAAVDACLRPGETMRAGAIRYKKTGSWLRCYLPSGRSIFYPFPRLAETKTPWGAVRLQIRFHAVDGMTKRWTEFALFGGLQMQNVVQAASRDVMMEAMIRLEEAGYPNILRVHDELIHEVDEGFGDEEEFHRLVAMSPTWAPDLPVACDGWVGTRYKK